MNVALMVLIFAIFTGLAIALSAHSRNLWRAALREACRELGLIEEQGSFWKSSKASGVLAGRFPTTIDTYTVSTGKSSQVYTRIRVGTNVERDVLFEAEGAGASFKKWFLGSDVEVGDALFDSAVVVRGREDELLARLNAEARDAVMAAVAERAKLKDGELLWVRGGLVKDGQRLIEVTQTLGRAAELLDAGGGVEAIAENAMSDPVPSFRLACLQRLVDHYAERPVTRRAVDAALTDREPAIRVLAASAAGPAGVPVLLQLARDPGAPITQRAAALGGLAAGSAALAGVAEALDEALGEALDETYDDELRDAALAACGVSGHDPERALLARLAPLAGPAGRVGIARTLTRSRAPLGDAGEDLLRSFLDGEPAEPVAIAAIEALGARASTRAVEWLLPLSKGFGRSGDIKDAARGAISTIQSRVEGAGAGQLSVLEAAESSAGGELSLSATAQGALSEAAPDADEDDDASSEDAAAEEDLAEEEDWPALVPSTTRDG